jgi:hypothetical protein
MPNPQLQTRIRLLQLRPRLRDLIDLRKHSRIVQLIAIDQRIEHRLFLLQRRIQIDQPQPALLEHVVHLLLLFRREREPLHHRRIVPPLARRRAGNIRLRVTIRRCWLPLHLHSRSRLLPLARLPWLPDALKGRCGGGPDVAAVALLRLRPRLLRLRQHRAHCAHPQNRVATQSNPHCDLLCPSSPFINLESGSSGCGTARAMPASTCSSSTNPAPRSHATLARDPSADCDNRHRCQREQHRRRDRRRQAERSPA